MVFSYGLEKFFHQELGEPGRFFLLPPPHISLVARSPLPNNPVFYGWLATPG
jgi:hypothetical protein